MIPATVTLKGIWAALIALAFAIILALLAVQTVRIEGIKIWPLNLEGYKAKSERLQADLDKVKAAQVVALEKAVAAVKKVEQNYRTLAEKTDAKLEKARTDAMLDAERYIAAHRLHPQAVGGSPGGSSAAAEGGNPEVVGEVPEDALVAVSVADVRACTVNSTDLMNAHDWAVGLNEQPKELDSANPTDER